MNRLSEQSGTGPTASARATSTWLKAGWRWREADTAAVGRGSGRRQRHHHLVAARVAHSRRRDIESSNCSKCIQAAAGKGMQPSDDGSHRPSPTCLVHRPDEADEQHGLRHEQQVGLPGAPPAGRGRAWQGVAGRGRAWQGVAGCGRVWQGVAGCGHAGPRESVGSSRRLGRATTQVA